MEGAEGQRELLVARLDDEGGLKDPGPIKFARSHMLSDKVVSI
jgi:hypothetical protein